MAVETDAYRLLMLQDWGIDATYLRDKRYGTEKTIKVIFDNEVEEFDAGGTTTFHVEQPRILCRTSDVDEISEGDDLTIDSVKYTVLIASPDGQGFTTIRLEKQ